MKKRGIWLGVILVLFILCYVVHFSCTRYHHITDLPIIVGESTYNPFNYCQYGTTVSMFTWDGKLYIFPYGAGVKEQLKRKLCVFEENTIHTLLDDCHVYAVENGYVYYDEMKNSYSQSYQLMCLDLRSAQVTELLPTEDLWSDVIVDEEQTCYIPKDFRLSSYYAVKDGVVTECKEAPRKYLVGENTYTVEDGDLICYRSSGLREVVLDSIGIGKIYIIPHQLGLLVFNNGATDLLYFIPNATGEIEQLFAVQGLSTESSANVYGEFVYVSFVRYKGFDDIGVTKYENDTVEGTYRISLVDRSVEKLTDEKYDGLYIFDDTGIFACKDGCIYKLNFDGQRILTLLE